MSAISEVKIETTEIISTDNITDTIDNNSAEVTNTTTITATATASTTTTTTATATDTTTTTTTTATATTAAVTTTPVTTIPANIKEEDKDSAENLIPSNVKLKDSENEQLHSDSVAVPDAKKTSLSSSIVAEEKAAATTENGAIAVNANTDKPKDAFVESSNATLTSPDEKTKEKTDVKDDEVGEVGEETAEKDYSAANGKKAESTTFSDKEASSDEADQFVDAKSSTQDASGDGAVENSGETKEQMEEVQDEEIYEYDEEEQEGEPDDDEVEDNPAFIPKSGRYYMHDSRNTDEERPPGPSPHSRADGKWKHDRFDERSQRPKTKRELMNRYGYDIRSEGKNTGNGNVDAPTTPRSNRSRGAIRGGSVSSSYGNRGKHSNRSLPHHPQQQSYDRRDHRRPVQNSGAGRPAVRGGRKVNHQSSVNHQREQHGTRVFKNSPMNAQKGTANRTNNHRSYERTEEYNRQNNIGNRARETTGPSGDVSTAHGKGGAQSGGKRYSTQRLATNYAPNIQPLPPQPPPLQPTPTTGPIPIPPPDWHPPAYRGPPPPPSTVPPPSAVPPPPPPPIAIPAPVPNFRPSDIVYFDPQPQQMYRTNPIPPRTKKRLEIVPPYQTKNA